MGAKHGIDLGLDMSLIDEDIERSRRDRGADEATGLLTAEELLVAKNVRTFVLVIAGTMFTLFFPPIILVYLGVWLYNRRQRRLEKQANLNSECFIKPIQG